MKHVKTIGTIANKHFGGIKCLSFKLAILGLSERYDTPTFL